MNVPDHVTALMTKELQHEDVDQRISAALRFHSLWRFRHQVRPRLQVMSNPHLKAPPANIDFVLPSPTIGTPLVTMVDPPWQPLFKSKVEEVTIGQEGSVS